MDYFTKHGINKLSWEYDPVRQDRYTVPFKYMFDDAAMPSYDKIVHIGCSLGGFFGIYKSECFTRNYCFYPGMIAFTDQMLEKDYGNTVVITGELDTWCDNYHIFNNQCRNPPSLVKVNATHGFMIPGKDKTIYIAKYRLPAHAMSETDFERMIPNHQWLSEKFGFDQSEILLLHDETNCNRILNHILEEVDNI